jgi:phage shock protein A
MGLARRIALVFKTKANKALDRAEDPREVLDYSYQRQLEMLAQVRRGLADVATSRRRIDMQYGQLESSGEKLRAQAADALTLGREDIAREALSRRMAVTEQMGSLATQRDSLQAEEEKLTLASQRLQAKVEAFRTRKETIKATYTAAEAQTKITEAVTGISEEMGDVGMAMQRAEDKTAQMQARAQALDGLLESGALSDATLPTGGGGDDIQAALDSARGTSDVDLELAAMRRQLSAPESPKAIGPRTEQGR